MRAVSEFDITPDEFNMYTKLNKMTTSMRIIFNIQRIVHSYNVFDK